MGKIDIVKRESSPRTSTQRKKAIILATNTIEDSINTATSSVLQPGKIKRVNAGNIMKSSLNRNDFSQKDAIIDSLQKELREYRSLGHPIFSNGVLMEETIVNMPVNDNTGNKNNHTIPSSMSNTNQNEKTSEDTDIIMEEGDEIIRVVNNNLLESSEIQQLKQDILRHETLAFVREQELNNTIQVLLDNTRQLQEGIMSSNVKEFSKPNHAFIMKNLRTFSGKDPDTFDSWILQTKFILEDSNLTEKEKVRIVLMKLDGNARELVDNLKVTNTETIFKVL